MLPNDSNTTGLNGDQHTQVVARPLMVQKQSMASSLLCRHHEQKCHPHPPVTQHTPVRPLQQVAQSIAHSPFKIICFWIMAAVKSACQPTTAWSV